MASRLRVCLFLVTGCLYSTAFAGDPAITFSESKYQVDVKIGGKLFTSYLHTPDPDRSLLAPGVLQAKPVLYPVLSPSGTAMTRGYPFDEVPGEDQDHPHHMGIYFTVDRVNGEQNGFWNNSKNPLPAIRHVKVLAKKEGSGKGSLATLSEWIGTNGKPLLQETREMVFLVLDESSYAIDFTITLEPVQGEVAFEDTKEGMFAVRVAQWLTEKETGRYLNSQGEELEEGVWGKRASWIRLQGKKDGRPLGIAILDHPTSTNAPTYWHARGYGCFSVNPLGQLDFQKAHKEAEAEAFNLRLQPGQKALFKYRVIIYEGDLGQENLDTLYRAFAR
jgi:hypothetical protein